MSPLLSNPALFAHALMVLESASPISWSVGNATVFANTLSLNLKLGMLLARSAFSLLSELPADAIDRVGLRLKEVKPNVDLVRQRKRQKN